MGICDYTKRMCDWWVAGPDGSECTEPQVGLCPANDAEDLEAIREWKARRRRKDSLGNRKSYMESSKFKGASHETGTSSPRGA